jgi:predicted transcriptional regulator
MDQDTVAQPARPRLNPYTKALRRERIFSRLRLGASSADIAREEGLSEQRVRKIVADALKRQEVEDPPDHALIHLVRLEGAQALAAETIAGGDLKAIAPYLQVLDRIDRYRKAGATKEVYDAAARERLFAKMNRVVARLEAEARKLARKAAAEPRPGRDAETRPDSDVSL